MRALVGAGDNQCNARNRLARRRRRNCAISPPGTANLSWYREFAERAGSTTIWETRLHMAEDLDHEADRLERDRIARKFAVTR